MWFHVTRREIALYALALPAFVALCSRAGAFSALGRVIDASLRGGWSPFGTLVLVSATFLAAALAVVPVAGLRTLARKASTRGREGSLAGFLAAAAFTALALGNIPAMCSDFVEAHTTDTAERAETMAENPGYRRMVFFDAGGAPKRVVNLVRDRLGEAKTGHEVEVDEKKLDGWGVAVYAARPIYPGDTESETWGMRGDEIADLGSGLSVPEGDLYVSLEKTG